MKQSKRNKRKIPTPFQDRVYNLTRKIPKGKVTTYGLLSKKLKSSPRAVGNALRNNPYAPEVPCHRVVSAALEMHGFDGQSGKNAPKLVKKQKMLEEEGVLFGRNNKVLRKSVWSPFEQRVQEKRNQGSFSDFGYVESVD
eukprot:snap_masked-scaffold_4-processed-gene-14.35-mRNA-1 protein AED:0.44 eAED:0.44 QI:0/-1/0/1/-1/1/1/0/139